MKLIVPVRVSIILFLCSYLLSCDSDPSEVGRDTKDANEAMGRSSLQTEHEQSTKHAYICGRVMVKSDVSSIPDIPFRQGMVLVVKAKDFSSLLEEAELVNAGNGVLRLTRFRMSKQVFYTYVQNSSVVGEKGAYKLELASGGYLMCLAKRSKARAEKFPLNVEGCFRLKVKEGDKHFIDIVIGVGGVRFIECPK